MGMARRLKSIGCRRLFSGMRLESGFRNPLATGEGVEGLRNPLASEVFKDPRDPPGYRFLGSQGFP